MIFFLVLLTALDFLPLISTHESQTSPCPALYIDIMRNIAGHVNDYTDSESLLRSKKEVYSSCGYILQDRMIRYFIGETRSFLPVVKRCIIMDNVKCLHIVKEHFRKKELLSASDMEQLPALSAQLGAYRIFQSLKGSPNDTRWNAWMTRALVRGRYTFLQKVLQLKSTANVYEAAEISPRSYYDGRQLLDVLPDKYERFPQPTLSQDDKLVQLYHSETDFDWIDSTFYDATNYTITPTKVFKAFAIRDPTKRETKLQHLQKRMKKVLRGGVYIMDDMIGSTNNMAKLWWHYGPHGSDNRCAWFLQWVLEQGAPIGDTSLLKEFQLARSKKTLEFIEKYTHLLNLAIKYRHGSDVAALVWHLRHGVEHSSMETLSLFARLLHTDITNPLVRNNALEVAARTSSSKIRNEFITIYSQQLTNNDLSLLKRYIQAAAESMQHQEKMLQVLNVLSSAVSRHQDLASRPSPRKSMDEWISYVLY